VLYTRKQKQDRLWFQHKQSERVGLFFSAGNVIQGMSNMLPSRTLFSHTLSRRSLLIWTNKTVMNITVRIQRKSHIWFNKLTKRRQYKYERT